MLRWLEVSIAGVLVVSSMLGSPVPLLVLGERLCAPARADPFGVGVQHRRVLDAVLLNGDAGRPAPVLALRPAMGVDVPLNPVGRCDDLPAALADRDAAWLSKGRRGLLHRRHRSLLS